MTTRSGHHNAGLIVGLLAIFALAVPSDSREAQRVFDACEQQRSGKVRIVASPRDCVPGERAIVLERAGRARKPETRRDREPGRTDRAPVPSRDRQAPPREEPPDATPPDTAPSAHRSLGDACTLNAQCGSGFCRDGVCCDGPCSATCEACSVGAGGSAQGHCTRLVGGGTSGELCPPPGDANPPERATFPDLGESCTSNSQCESGFCRDAVCCDGPCSGACQACSVGAGGTSQGRCTAIVGGGVRGEGC